MPRSRGDMGCRLVQAAVAWAWLCGGAATAQGSGQQPATTPSLAIRKAGVPLGAVVYVSDAAGVTIRGKLSGVTGDEVRVSVAGATRRLAASDLRRIQWQRRDSPLTGVLIGAAVGAAPGLYWLLADPNECHGLCAEDYAFIAIGAAIGGLIDHAIKGRVTIYSSAAPDGRTTTITIEPLAARSRRGVQLSLRF
jgi:hypothetical protein